MSSQFTLTALPQYIVPRVSTFCTQVQKYYQTSSPVVSWIDRKVMLLTEVLPKPGPCIVYHLWKSTPYIVASILLPPSWYIAGIVAAVAYYFMSTPINNTPDLSPVANGVGFSYTICGVGSLFAGALTHNPITSITGIFQLVIGGACLYASGFVDKVRQPFVPPPPSSPTQANKPSRPAEEPPSPGPSPPPPLSNKHSSGKTTRPHKSFAEKVEGFACRVVEKHVLKRLKIPEDAIPKQVEELA